MAQKTQLQQFYIPEEQSIYLLSHDDAKKLKDWVALCAAQLGYQNIELIGKGAYGFVFSGRLPGTAAGARNMFSNSPASTCLGIFRTGLKMKPTFWSRSAIPGCHG